MNEFVNIAQLYVKRLLSEKLPKEYVYHNCRTMESIYEEAIIIGESVMLDNYEMEIVALAVLFCNTGYIHSHKFYSERSCKIAEDHLKNNKYPNEKLKQVLSTISSLNSDKKPENRIQQVFLDALTSFYGKNSFFEMNGLLKLENELLTGKNIKNKKWLKESLHKLENHRFHTLYAKNMYNDKKKKNIKKIRKIISKKTDGVDKKNIRYNPFGRTVETMFRNNLRGHLELSALADNKANIMLSINAIIISIILTIMLPNIMEYSEFLIATILVIITCVTAIVFATLATRPKVTKGTFTREDILKKRTNLLFFGNFFKMNIDDFQWGMSEMMKDKDYLYSSMIKDFYYLGLVLHKKFFYLRICYSVFMFGFIISIAAYLITFFIIK